MSRTAYSFNHNHPHPGIPDLHFGKPHQASSKTLTLPIRRDRDDVNCAHLILTSFKVARSITTGNNSNESNGQIPGKSFYAIYASTDTPDLFMLSIGSLHLPDEAARLTAILLTDLIFLRQIEVQPK